MLPLTRFLHSRFNAGLALTLMLAGAWLSYSFGEVLTVPGDKAVALPPAVSWFASAPLSFAVNLACNMLVVALMILINRRYNFLKSMTLIFVSLFAVMQLATPPLLTRFYSGTLLCVVLLFCVSMLFSCFGNRGPVTMRKVFMVFFLLSGLTATQYVYAGYILVFLLGCMQMRIFSLRCFLAVCTGIVTPWLIMIGSGMVEPAGMHWPSFVSIFAGIGRTETMAFLITVSLTVLLLVTAMALTVFKMLTYTARRRASNGLITLIAAYTVVALCVDYTNIITYIPILNVCAAYAVSHFFALHNTEKSYIAILSLYAVYLVLFAWKIVI